MPGLAQIWPTSHYQGALWHTVYSKPSPQVSSGCEEAERKPFGSLTVLQRISLPFLGRTRSPAFCCLLHSFRQLTPVSADLAHLLGIKILALTSYKSKGLLKLH